jgi:hypothetical protein
MIKKPEVSLKLTKTSNLPFAATISTGRSQGEVILMQMVRVRVRVGLGLGLGLGLGQINKD